MSEDGKSGQSDVELGLVEKEDHAPSGTKETSTTIFSALEASFARSGPGYHPIFGKFDSDHVTLFLTQAHEQDTGELRIRGTNRWFRLVYVLIGVAVFVFLTLLLLPERADLYFEILKALGIFAAGTAGGYGLKAYQDRNRT